MQLEEKKKLVLAASDRMRDYVIPFVTSIMGIAGGGRTVTHIGTGLRCVLADRPCLVTAWHVVHEATNISQGPRPGSSYDALGISVGSDDQVCAILKSQIHLDLEADLAVIPVPEEFQPNAAELRTSYWQSGRVSLDPEVRKRDYLFLLGFPDQGSYSTHLFGLGSTHVRSLPYGAMERIDDLPGDLKPFQFALPFDAEGMRRVQSEGQIDSQPDPRGLSGSPVWRIGASGRRAEDWSPVQSSLVGIVTQWRPNDRLLVVSDASRVIDLATPS